MKTISLKTNTIGPEIPDPRDKRYVPSKRFQRTWPIMDADGLHFYSQLADGLTTTHTMIPIQEIVDLVEKLQPDYAIPIKAG